MAMEPNALNSQPLSSALSLSNTDSLQEVLHEKNDRKLSGYVNTSTEFFENITQLQRKRRRQGPHNDHKAPRKMVLPRRAPEVGVSSSTNELASALNATNSKVHQLQGQVNELKSENMAQSVQLHHQFAQSQIVQMVAHQNYLQGVHHRQVLVQLRQQQEIQHQQQLFQGPPVMAPAPINLPPSKARAMIMMATKSNFLDQVVPKRKATRNNYTSEYKVIDRTALKYETQREATVGNAETRAAKSHRSTKPKGDGNINIIMNTKCSLLPFGGSKAIQQMSSKATIAHGLPQ
jgi:hypothetical protein